MSLRGGYVGRERVYGGLPNTSQRTGNDCTMVISAPHRLVSALTFPSLPSLVDVMVERIVYFNCDHRLQGTMRRLRLRGHIGQVEIGLGSCFDCGRDMVG